MATQEGTRASAEFMCICLAPDVCKSPTIPVPYKILSLFDCAVNFSTTVRFRTRFAFRHNSRLSTVRCDEAGVGGGVLSGVNLGFCRPIPTTHSKTVRVNGSFVDYHVGTYMFMNCAGPEGPFNTIGQVIFLGNMLPGPVGASGKIPKGCICGDSGMLSEIQSKLGDADDLIAKGKKLYELAKTDWSDPSAVLGAIGGVVGIAGLQDVADLAKQGKEIYDTGKKILDTDWSDPSSILGALGGAAGIGGFKETAAMIAKGKDLFDKGKKILGTDWSDPKQALAAVASGATIAGMDGIASAAELASKVRDVIKTDWSDPKAALAAATNIMKSTGLNKMVAGLASDAITSSDPNGASNQLPSCFPKPGSNSQSASSKNGLSNSSPSPVGLTPNDPNWLPPSQDGKPRQRITQDVLDDMKINNPTALERYELLSEAEKKEAFIETNKPSKTKDGQPVPENKRTAVYLPGQGFSTTPEERENSFLPPLPKGIKEIFVAEKDGDKENFLGIKQKKGNWYLFGGLVDLGSPDMPGAGDANMWFIPDNIFGIDMSKYFDHHDEHYYGSDVGLGDIGSVLGHELSSFAKGLSLNPLQWPLQAIYSTATTGVGLATILQNTTKQVDGALSDVLGKIDSGSFKDIFSSVFGASEVNPNDLVINNIVPGGCMGPEVPTLPGQSAPGTGSGAPGSGAPPKPGTAGAPDGNASGAGKDGILITTKQGNPAAAAAAIEAQFRKDNKAALEKAQAEEKAAQEKAAQEKAAQEKAAQKRAAQDKEAQDKEAGKSKIDGEANNTTVGDEAKKKEPEASKTNDANKDEGRNSNGGKHYSDEEVKAILKDIEDQNIIQSFFDHAGGGRYDFKHREPNATFDVNGTSMNAAEFGNYMAGYAGRINGGDLGELGVRLGGVGYDLADSIAYDLGLHPPIPPGMDPPKFDWDEDSKPAINAGVEQAKKDDPGPPPLPPGYQRHPIFLGIVIGPDGESMTEEEARLKFMA